MAGKICSSSQETEATAATTSDDKTSTTISPSKSIFDRLGMPVDRKKKNKKDDAESVEPTLGKNLVDIIQAARPTTLGKGLVDFVHLQTKSRPLPHKTALSHHISKSVEAPEHQLQCVKPPAEQAKAESKTSHDQPAKPLSREPSKEETLRKFLQAKNVNCDKKSAKNTVASEELPNSNTEQPAKLKTKKKTTQRQIRKRHENGRSSSTSGSSSSSSRSSSDNNSSSSSSTSDNEVSEMIKAIGKIIVRKQKRHKKNKTASSQE